MKKTLVLVFVFIIFKTKAQTNNTSIADSLYLNENYAQAISIYKLNQNQPLVYHKIGKSYAASGNYQQALYYYKQSITANPENALNTFDYAKLLYKNRKFEEANLQFLSLTKSNASNPNYYYHLGLCLEKIKDSSAFNTFKKVVKLDSTHQKAIFKIAKQFLKKREHDSVDYYVGVGLKNYQNNVDLISLQAQNYFHQKQYRKARQWFEKLIVLNINSQFIQEKLSACYQQTFEYKKAIQHRLLALDYDPKNITNLYVLGHLYQQIEDFTNAEKYIEKSLQLEDVPLDEKYINLAIVLNHQKKHEEALKVLKIAIKENPNNEKAHFFIATTKDKFYKDIDQKIKAYQTFNKNFSNSDYKDLVSFRLKELKTEKFRQSNN